MSGSILRLPGTGDSPRNLLFSPNKLKKDPLDAGFTESVQGFYKSVTKHAPLAVKVGFIRLRSLPVGENECSKQLQEARFKMTEERKDSQLVQEFLNGDRDSFVELIGRYSEKVHNLAMRITRNEQDAEEVLQDVFITVFKKMDTFQGKSAFSSWLYRITANTAFMKLRQRKKHAAVSLDESPTGAGENMLAGGRSDSCDLNYMTSRHELRAALEEAISKLPEEYKTIFILRDVDGLSNHEVGEILGLSVPAVKSRLHRSRLMLRKKLQRYYEDYVNDDQIFYGLNPQARGGQYQAAA